MSLAQAIDELLAFVDSRAALPVPEQVVSRYREWGGRFDTLDRAVWVEACRLGWESKLPQGSEGSRYHYLGLTKLPALGSRAVFEPAFLRAWKNILLALRDLAAEAGAGHDQGGAGQGEGKRPPRRRGRKPDTNPKEDQRVADAWASGQYKTYEELANALGRKERDVKLALDRVRWRERPPEAKRRRRSK
jgi:hypothetical protein